MTYDYDNSSHHKTEESSKYGRYAPSRIPCIWMVITNRQTQASVGFKSTIGRHHVNAGGFKWKIPGKH